MDQPQLSSDVITTYRRENSEDPLQALSVTLTLSPKPTVRSPPGRKI
jgi:hypothetical protein